MVGLLSFHAGLRAAFDAWADRAIFYAPRLVGALVVLTVGFMLAKAARNTAVDSLAKATGDQRAGNAWGTIVQYAVMLLVIVASLAVAGVNLGALMVAVGAIGFALAFAMQDTIANFISGLIILTAHPFADGDAVRIAGEEGTVETIGMRSTQLRTFDGLRVEVPNKNVLNQAMTVFSYHDTRRWDVLVGISYDDDIPGAVDTVLDATRGVEGVLDDPEPEVFVEELGGSSVNLKVRFWTEKLPRGSMLSIKSEVTRAVKQALVDDGYDIPFPIRTIFMHEEGDGGNGGSRADDEDQGVTAASRDPTRS